MKTLQIQTETANHLILNYKGELITIDSDCNELYIGTKMYKIAALRRHMQPKSEIKLLAAPKVHQAIIIPTEPVKHLKALSRCNVKLLGCEPLKALPVKKVKSEPITTILKNGIPCFTGNQKDTEKWLLDYRKMRKIELLTVSGDKKYKEGYYESGSSRWHSHHNPELLEKDTFTFETQY